MSKEKTDEKYIVYNKKGSYQQTYDASFADAFEWARQCANHVGGKVVRRTKKDGVFLEDEIYSVKE